MTLTPDEVRVLGALMEKEMVTPDIYPLSLNALLAACNQRSSREPVTDLTDDQVQGALAALEVQALVIPARDGGRVPKYEHRIRTVLNLRRDETALLCLLLLRGPQTPGELRSRSDRMFQFDDLAQVSSTLERLAAREEPLVAALPRIPGSREGRWAHLIGDPAVRPLPSPAADDPPGLQAEVQALREAVTKLEERMRVVEQRLPLPAGLDVDGSAET